MPVVFSFLNTKQCPRMPQLLDNDVGPLTFLSGVVASLLLGHLCWGICCSHLAADLGGSF